MISISLFMKKSCYPHVVTYKQAWRFPNHGRTVCDTFQTSGDVAEAGGSVSNTVLPMREHSGCFTGMTGFETRAHITFFYGSETTRPACKYNIFFIPKTNSKTDIEIFSYSQCCPSLLSSYIRVKEVLQSPKNSTWLFYGFSFYITQTF